METPGHIGIGELHNVRLSEVQELWLAYFMLLYILYLRQRLKAALAA